MALTYDSTKCSEEAKQKIYDDRNFAWNLSAATVNAGMSRITESNFEEFWTRYCVFEQSIGGFLYITKEDARLCVGFTTNAETLSAHVFNKRIISNIYRSAPKVVKPAPFLEANA